MPMSSAYSLRYTIGGGGGGGGLYTELSKYATVKHAGALEHRLTYYTSKFKSAVDTTWTMITNSGCSKLEIMSLHR